MMQSAISRGVSIGMLLVSHRITTFFTDDGKGISMSRHRAFSTRSPPILKFKLRLKTQICFALNKNFAMVE